MTDFHPYRWVEDPCATRPELHERHDPGLNFVHVPTDNLVASRSNSAVENAEMSTTKNFAKVAAVALFSTLISQAVAQSAQGKPHPECCSIVVAALDAVSHIHAGMSRAEVEKLFVVDGGLIFRDKTRYSFRDCRSIKVEITFDRDKQVSGVIGSPTDTVKAVDRPYLEYPLAD